MSAYKKFFEEIITCIRGNEYLYGPCVRDKVAGLERNKVSIKLSDTDSTDLFFTRVKNLFGATNVTLISSRIINVYLDGQNYSIELTPEKGFSFKPSADVDALYADGPSCYHPLPVKEEDRKNDPTRNVKQFDVIKNILDRKFLVFKNSDVGAIKELESKGFTHLNKSSKSMAKFKFNPQTKYKIGDKVVVRSNGKGTPAAASFFQDGQEIVEKIVGVYKDGAHYTYVLSVSNPSAEGTWSFGVNPFDIDKLAVKDNNYTGKCYAVVASNVLGTLVEDPPEIKASDFPEIKFPEIKFSSTFTENKTIKKVEVKTMSNKISPLETFKTDATDASYRVVAKQISKAARASLLELLKSNGVKRNHIKAVSEMLDTEAGLAAVSVALGWALRYVPGLKDDPRAQLLAKEFRVDGMATSGNLLLGAGLETFIPMVMGHLSKLPEPTKVRVSAPAELTSKQEKVDLIAQQELEAEQELVTVTKSATA